MRKQTVKVAGRIVEVKELTIGEIKRLFEKYSGDYAAFLAGQENENLDAMIEFFQTKVGEIFPELDGVSIDDVYPSELEALGEAFLAVNFTGVRKLLDQIFKLADRAGQFRAPIPGPGK